MSWEKWTPVTLDRSKVEAKAEYVAFFYLHPDIRAWLVDHAGVKARFFTSGPTGDWHHDIPMAAKDVTFYFRDPRIATLFKLTFV